MVSLTRKVRFCLPLGASPAPPCGFNTYAAWPAIAGLGVFYEVEVTCRGEPDTGSGLFLNTALIDRAVRDGVLPLVAETLREAPENDPGALIPAMIRRLQPDLGHAVARLAWWLTPYHCLMVQTGCESRVTVIERYEFAASHRLHQAELSDQENRTLFGKCNNPSGHGHNYQLEVAVSRPIAADGPAAPSPAELERVVKEAVIDRLDHKHLNVDVEEFAGKNPTVEAIATVCHGLLHSRFEALGAELEYVTVWETEKTRCTYPAGAGG